MFKKVIIAFTALLTSAGALANPVEMGVENDNAYLSVCGEHLFAAPTSTLNTTMWFRELPEEDGVSKVELRLGIPNPESNWDNGGSPNVQITIGYQCRFVNGGVKVKVLELVGKSYEHATWSYHTLTHQVFDDGVFKMGAAKTRWLTRKIVDWAGVADLGSSYGQLGVQPTRDREYYLTQTQLGYTAF